MTILGMVSGRRLLHRNPAETSENLSSLQENTQSGTAAVTLLQKKWSPAESSQLQLVSHSESATEQPTDNAVHTAGADSVEASPSEPSGSGHGDAHQAHEHTADETPASVSESLPPEHNPESEHASDPSHPSDGSAAVSDSSAGHSAVQAESSPDPFQGAPAAIPAPDAQPATTARETAKDPAKSLAATQYLANQMEQADDDLRSGAFARAIRKYQALEKKSTGDVSAGLEFRLALCAEVMGNYAEAIDAYQRLVRHSSRRNWVGVSTFGEARCLVSLGRHDAVQSDLLRRVMLDETTFNSTIRSELLHLLGRSQWHRLLPQEKANLLVDSTLSLPDWHPESHVTLDALQEAIQADNPPTESLQLTILQASEKDPREIFLKVHSASASPTKLINAIAGHCRFELQATPQSLQALDGRTLQIHVADRSLAMILDGLTIPFGNLWQLDGETIRVSAIREVSSDETRQFQTDAAERLLRTALLESPTSVQAGYTRLALGSLLFARSQLADAGHLFRQQAELTQQSTVVSDAAFNLAKCQLALKQPEDARKSFLSAVDSSGGNSDVRLAAYLYAGRLQIELGKNEDAITTLMYALSLSDRTEMEPQAAMILATAYLLAKNPQGASSVLAERRDALHDESLRDASAFLSSLSRFRAAVLPDRKEREGRSVVEAMAHLHPEKQFGAHWCLLMADAADELGLTQQSTDGYLQVLQMQPAKPLRDQALLKLASRFQADRRLEDAHLLLTAVTPEDSQEFSQVARLRNAEVAIDQGKPRVAIEFCRELLNRRSTPELRRETLRVMGRAYERLRNHRAAVYCFAGMVPTPAVEAEGFRDAEASSADGGFSEGVQP
jgi:tetratricopeptide (TPR) repeat protein